jgi:amidase
MDLDLATGTASELTQAIRDRQLSSRELLDALLDRAERLNPALNAIVAWDTDRARAAAAARATPPPGASCPARYTGCR